jgi:hypothetical protein
VLLKKKKKKKKKPECRQSRAGMGDSMVTGTQAPSCSYSAVSRMCPFSSWFKMTVEALAITLSHPPLQPLKETLASVSPHRFSLGVTTEIQREVGM